MSMLLKKYRNIGFNRISFELFSTELFREKWEGRQNELLANYQW